MTARAKTQKHRAAVLWAVALAFIAAMPLACTPKPCELAFRGTTMGTTYSVKVALHDPPAEMNVRRMRGSLDTAIEAELAQVNALMSTYDPNSALSNFNKWQETTPFAFPADAIDVFTLAGEVSRESGGAFDITVGPLVNAWGFGPDKRPEKVPTPAEIERLRERVGYQRLTVDRMNGTVTKGNPDMYCDMSAIAKGFGVDKVAEALERTGFTDYMVEVGGEVRTAGTSLRGKPWRIAIEKPTPEGRAIERVVPLSGLAMATSGDYRNYYEVDAKRLSHTIDPRTGAPITHTLASASVIHEECAVADALATALMVLGPEEGMALAERLKLKVLLIVREAPGQFTELESSAFSQFVKTDGSRSEEH